MNGAYTEKFNVLEVFERNDHQKILMGTKKSLPDDVVVINIFKKGSKIDEVFKNNLEKALGNLIHIEETQEEIIAVTEYREGISFTNFMNSANISLNERIQLIHQYLLTSSNYDIFDNYFKNIFVDENQIIAKDNKFYLNELLILDNSIDDYTPFEKISSKIASTIKKIGFENLSSDSSENYDILKNFVKDMEQGSASYSNLSEILNSYEGAFKDMKFTSENPSEMRNKVAAATSVGVASGAIADATFDDDSSSTKEEDPQTSDLEDISTEDMEDELTVETDVPSDETQLSTEEIPPVDDVLKDEFKELDEDSSNNETSSIGTDTDEILESSKADNSKDDEPTIKEVELDNIIVHEEPAEKKSGKIDKKVIAAVVLALLAAIAVFALLPSLLSKKEPPIASFERISSGDSIRFVNTSVAKGKNNEIVTAVWKVLKNGEEKFSSDKLKEIVLTFKNDGEYVVTLRVQDKNELWSEEYSETIVSNVTNADNVDIIDEDAAQTKEKLDNFTIDKSKSDNIINDFEVFRSGNQSLKLDLTKNGGVAEFSLEDITLDKNYIVSMWVMSDKTDPITIEFTGFNGSEVKFVKEITYTPKMANTWEMVELKISSSLVNKLNMKFTGEGSTLWIDDIDTNSYK